MTTATTVTTSKGIQLGAKNVSPLLKELGYEGGDMTIELTIKGGSFENSSCAGSVRLAQGDWLKAIIESGKFNAIEMQDLLATIALNCRNRTVNGEKENKEIKAAAALLKQLSKFERKEWEALQEKRKKENKGNLPHWSKRMAGAVAKSIPSITKNLLKFDTITAKVK